MWPVFPFFGGTGLKRKRRKRVSPKGVSFVFWEQGIPLYHVCASWALPRKLIQQFLSQIQQSDIFKVVLNMQFV